MIRKKCVNNNQWKLWDDHANIHVPSNSLPSMYRPWRHTHYGGMGKPFKKCWSTTQNILPLWLIAFYCDKGGPDMEGQT